LTAPFDIYELVGYFVYLQASLLQSNGSITSRAIYTLITRYAQVEPRFFAQLTLGRKPGLVHEGLGDFHLQPTQMS
jgi:hypothetical protein